MFTTVVLKSVGRVYMIYENSYLSGKQDYSGLELFMLFYRLHDTSILLSGDQHGKFQPLDDPSTLDFNFSLTNIKRPVTSVENWLF